MSADSDTIPAGVEILDVMMSMLSGVKDDFGKEEVPPLPLSFDRVCRGHSQQSTALLFRLPTEVMGMILQCIAPDSLASLALVNRDCLQWARSRQFASVHLDYSKSSLDLIQRVLKEASGHQSATSSNTPLPRLGLCIRRITVATNPDWVTFRHGVGFDQEFEDLSEEERSNRMVDASSAFFGIYIPSIQNILNPVVLPHLELLDWEDKIALPQSFFEALATSPIKYLKLFRVKLNEQFDITAQLASKTPNWPLRTLHLELFPKLCWSAKISTSPLSASILRSCSPTLEDLRLTTGRLEDYSFTQSNTNTLPQFPKLRRLSIGRIGFNDSSMLEALVSSSLRHLEVGRCWTPIYRDFFENRGTISNLNTFVWEGRAPDEPPYSFLHANPHLAKLALPNAVPSTTMKIHIVPLLGNFRGLTSLSLVWEGTSISNSALRQISSLKTLRQIHLSAGEQLGWKYDWRINHDSLRRYLRTLPLLEKLAFSRDSYSSDVFGIETELYYTQWDSQRWEPRHRRRIVDQAKKYVKVMPQLKWIYFGQLPMDVETSEKTGSRFVRLLSEERDDCWTFLRRMFGGCTD